MQSILYNHKLKCTLFWCISINIVPCKSYLSKLSIVFVQIAKNISPKYIQLCIAIPSFSFRMNLHYSERRVPKTSCLAILGSRLGRIENWSTARRNPIFRRFLQKIGIFWYQRCADWKSAIMGGKATHLVQNFSQTSRP